MVSPVKLAVEPLFEAIASHSTDSIMLLDREARILFINKTAPGLTVDQVLGTLIYAYVPEDQHAAMRECFENVLRTGEPARYENAYHINEDLVMRWESRIGPVMPDGEITGFVVFASDVTARTAAALERDLIFELSADLMCVVGFDGHFTRVNPAFTRTLGYSESELLSNPFLDFVHTDDHGPTKALFLHLLFSSDTTSANQHTVSSFENRYLCKDGGIRRLQWSAIPDAASKRIIAVARDITEQRMLEEQLRQSQKMEAVGQLAGGVAHDFNNLVQVILGNVHFALASQPDSGMRELLGDIAAAGERAAGLTKQLLAFSRRQPLKVSNVNLNHLIRDVTQLLRRVIPENIEIEVSVHEQLEAVAADRSQLEQVVMNLCLNARDAMPLGGRLTLRTENLMADGGFVRAHPWVKLGHHVLLAVDDNGAGMTKEVQARIFEPFYTTKPTGEGTGLGLAVAYGIVQQHGGLMHVQSELGRGSSFKLYLPVSHRHPGDVEPAFDSATKSGFETILLAEDEVAVRSLLVRALVGAGYRVLAAAGGAEAIQLYLENDSIALVILDVVMPDFSGPQVYERIQKVRPGVPVLFCSGYSDVARVGHQLPTGAPLLSKPVNLDTFLANVRLILDAPT